MAGPFHPVRSGVAIYNSRLARRLAEVADLECFVEGDWRESDTPPGSPLPVSALGTGRRQADFDGVIAVLGNSGAHASTYDVLRRVPSIAWFHDVNLTGLHRERSRRAWPADPEAFMLDALRASYGERARIPANLLDHEELAKDGILMSAEAARLAVRTIVSSSVAANLLSQETAGTIRSRPVVLPLAFPDVVTETAAPPSADAPLIVSLGYLHEIKRPDLLVDALACLGSDSRARLVFAGADVMRDPGALHERIRAADLQDRVTITGWLPDEEYRRLTRRADVVVQLRASSNGESSAAVNEAMACGRAVVTSVEACVDYPPGVVVQVPSDVTPDALAIELARVVDETDVRADLQAAALTFARAWTFNRVAAELVELALRGDQA